MMGSLFHAVAFLDGRATGAGPDLVETAKDRERAGCRLDAAGAAQGARATDMAWLARQGRRHLELRFEQFHAVFEFRHPLGQGHEDLPSRNLFEDLQHV